MCHKLGPSSDACRRELWGGSWPRQNTDCADRYWHLIKGYHWEADVGIRGAQRWNRWPRTRPIVAPQIAGISADMSRRDTRRVSEEGSLGPPLRGRWWSAEYGARNTQWKWSWLQGAPISGWWKLVRRLLSVTLWCYSHSGISAMRDRGTARSSGSHRVGRRLTRPRRRVRLGSGEMNSWQDSRKTSFEDERRWNGFDLISDGAPTARSGSAGFVCREVPVWPG